MGILLNHLAFLQNFTLGKTIVNMGRPKQNGLMKNITEKSGGYAKSKVYLAFKPTDLVKDARKEELTNILSCDVLILILIYISRILLVY